MKFLLLLVLALAGCQSAPKVTLRFHEQVSAALPPSRQRTVEIARANLRIPVSPFAALTERDVAGAELRATESGQSVVVRFDPHGALALDELTTRNRGLYLVVFVNDRPVTAWLVDRRLFSGQFIVEGDFSDAEAAELVAELNRLAQKRK